MKVDEATLRRTISKNIAAYRKAHKDTQAGLAEKLNYSDKSVSKWERGESVPDIYILTQIADLYGITVSNLIGEVEPPKASKPTYHMFILLLSVSLVFAIAAVLFSAFLIAEVPFRAWLFFVYAVPVSAIVCIVFTSLWWGIWQQGVSISVLIWSLGVCLYLSLPLPNLSLLFIVCAAYPHRCLSRRAPASTTISTAMSAPSASTSPTSVRRRRSSIRLPNGSVWP